MCVGIGEGWGAPWNPNDFISVQTIVGDESSGKKENEIVSAVHLRQFHFLNPEPGLRSAAGQVLRSRGRH